MNNSRPSTEAAGQGGSMMDEQELRRWAVEEVGRHHWGSAGNAVKEAAVLVDFVLGRDDAEIIRAARELAEKIKA